MVLRNADCIAGADLLLNKDQRDCVSYRRTKLSKASRQTDASIHI